ncbi:MULTISPECIES: alpha/beta fold hydrolase [Acinetobacter]|uniref:alpha/beta fold hydrolase n=1 Tax=Acinetobacter TaxID=469 RepID=UPI000992F658|nr:MULTISPECIES: alpha/beta fold hydrolase [Acinetobacter]MCL6245905.1 lipase family protein [Acinetobacter amyesii]OOV82024.1 triacylglycerol lipase [Acinetobacter sp. ANC 5600]
MKMLRLTVLVSSALFLAACGNDSNDQQFSNPETNADLNQIKNPVVTTTAYSQDNMPAVSADSRLMTYKMLGVDGKVVQATALVFTPKTVAPAGGWKIVAWAHGTTGVADKCAPSRQGLQGTEYLLQMLLAKGYVVVAPDYEGLGEPSGRENHPYLNLKSEAFSITDAVVAARSYLTSQGKTVSKDWLSIGHSQGGQAVLGAAEYASRADLNYKGTIAIAPANNLALILDAGEKLAVGKPATVQSMIYAPLDSFTAQIIAGMQGHKNSVDYSKVFSGHLAAIAPQAETVCSGELTKLIQDDMLSYASQNTTLDNYGRTQSDFLTLKPIQNFMSEGSQPLTTAVKTPIIIYQGKADQTIPADATKFMISLAKPGTSIDYREQATADHISIYTDNLANFVQDVETLMPNQ